MAKTPTAKEVSVDLAGFRSSVDQQFISLKAALAQAADAIEKRLDFFAKLVLAMFAIFPICIAGGFFLRNEIGDVKIELGKIGVQISGLREDLSRIEKRLDRPTQTSDAQLAIQTQMNSVLRRIEDRLNVSPPVPLALTDDEKSLIRAFFKLDKGPSREPSKYAIGDTITGAKEIPDELVNKLNKLQGLRVAFDPSDGSALLVAADNRIVAIVEPA
jgi:hypothetical protein